MFHWICPECGREIAPTVRECPVCDSGAEQEELVLAGVVEASARTSSLEASTRISKMEAPARSFPADEPGNGVELATAASDRSDSGIDSSVPRFPEPVKWKRPASDRAPIVESPAARTQETTAALPVKGPAREPAVQEALPKIDSSTSETFGGALTPEILDAKSAFDRAAETRVAEIRGVLTRAADAWVQQPTHSEARTVVTKTVESRAVEVRGVEVRNIEAKPVDTKSIEAKQIKTEQVEAKPIESKRLETQAADTNPVADQPIDSPVDRVPLLAKLSRLALPKIASAISRSESGKVTPDPGKETAPKIESVSTTSEAIFPSTPGSDPEIAVALAVPLAAQAGSIQPVPMDEASPAANLPVTTETKAWESVPQESAPQKPMLPAFAATDRESLNALLGALSLAEEATTPEQADPPAAGKLPLPICPAHVPPVAPALVSIGAVEPRTPTGISAPARAIVGDVTSPAEAYAHRIARLALIDSGFPLQRPPAQALKSTETAELMSLAPRAGAVRAPRSSAPFLAPDDAGLVKYDPLEKRPIRAVPPPVDLRKSPTAPRITLPGPMLTRPLVSFTGRELTPIFLEERAFRKRFTYGWIALVLAVGTVLGVGFSSMVTPPGRPPVEAKAASGVTSAADPVPIESASAEPNSVDNAAPASPVQATGSNPLSKSIEVTGFRIVMDPSRKPQVEYLVVNHSAARFPDATIFITLRAANARVGQAPLCRFSFAAPDLGPYEAKEMISAIQKTNRAVNLPEWQDLRAEVEIGR